MSLKARKILCLIVSIAALLLTLYAGGVFERSKSLTIAIASGSQDLEAVRGAQAYIDVVNQQGGIDGKPIKLEVFDDSNDSETAVKIAEEIATKSEALAVIGHRYSGTSIAAGEIYKEYGIPAISGSATAEAVTRGNAWYFRALFNNAAQARFLAQYTRKVLNQPTALIVYEPEEAYSSSLADAFELGFREFGGQIPHQFELSSGEELRQQVRRVANEIADLPAQEVGFVALLTSGNTAQAFVNAFKREGLSYLIAGGDALSSQNFINAFEIYANEQRRPGYYTDGIYSVAPLIYDVVDEEGARFRQQYLRQYQEEPSWVAGSFYDSARAMVKALELANVSGEPSEIATERQRVRDAIATFNDLDYAIDGISGPLYFDGSGDAQQIPTIGILERNKLTPAFNQLTPIVVPKSKSELEQGVESGEVVQFGSQFLNRTDIVYTGIRPTSIYEIHLEDDTFKMDFDMWFRYRSDLSEAEITNIRFINALNEPLLEQPSVQTQEDGTTYSLYKLSGTFSLDYLNPEDRGLGERVLSVSFINEQLSRSRLLYVTDSLGLNLSQTFSLKERLEAEQVLNSEPNWQVSKATFFQGLAQRELLNSPTASASSDGFNFAQFNLAITIVPNEISLRRTLHDRWAAYLFSVGIAMLALLFLQRRYRFFKLDSRAQWALKAVAALATLFALEPLTVDWLEQLITINYLEVVVKGFDILWWLLPAYLLGGFIDCFFWEPLVLKSGRSVPSLVHRMVLFIIYLLAAFCIIAYVFNRPLTSLLATSGIILTIVGLAIQINISNIFSGLAINLEKAFKVGDYIEIPSKNLKGHVVDINWRATRIQTRDQNIILVPNSDINNQTLVNYGLPHETSRATITFKLEPDLPVERAIQTLTKAVKAIAGKGGQYPLDIPEPYVILSDTDIYGIDYLVRCWYIPQDVSEDSIRDVVTRSVLKHLRIADIPLASHRGGFIDGADILIEESETVEVSR